MIYSILGVKLFWNVAPFDPIITPNANFKSFGFATSMLVRCMMVLQRARARARARPTSRTSLSRSSTRRARGTVGASSTAGLRGTLTAKRDRAKWDRAKWDSG